jgi:hypothetical protein
MFPPGLSAPVVQMHEDMLGTGGALKRDSCFEVQSGVILRVVGSGYGVSRQTKPWEAGDGVQPHSCCRRPYVITSQCPHLCTVSRETPGIHLTGGETKAERLGDIAKATQSRTELHSPSSSWLTQGPMG